MGTTTNKAVASVVHHGGDFGIGMVYNIGCFTLAANSKGEAKFLAAPNTDLKCLTQIQATIEDLRVLRNALNQLLEDTDEKH